MLKLESKNWVIPAIIIVTLFAFLLDYFTPTANAVYIFYFIPIAFCLLQENTKLPLIFAVICTILCIVGFHITDNTKEILSINRTIAIICIWVITFMVKAIIASKNEMARSNWIKETAASLNEKIRGELTTLEVGRKLLLFFSETIEAHVSAIYAREESQTVLSFLAGHGHDSDNVKKTVSFGDGLLGQAAIDKKLIIASPLKEDHLRVKTSLGNSQPNHLMILPLMADNDVVGVVELAFFQKPNDIVIEFLNQIQELTGTFVRSAQHKLRLSELLHQSQQFSEELQAQQEELKVSNEELEQQSKALKATHMRLESQQVEMEQTNQQLEEQTQLLENQKNLLDEKNQELERSRDELENKASELHKASQYKSEFLANMSHELRTPLNSTLILAKLLSENKLGNLNDEQVKYANIIYNSGNDLLNLINDILDLSKVEAGKMTISPEVVKVESTARALEQIFLPIANDKKIEFKLELAPSLPEEIITDRQRLDQILKNFLSNAIKFTPKGKVTLKVSQKEDRIAFAVSDTGVGISENEKEVIFEAFRQADGTTNRKFGGTGLGLSISKELAQILGGEIEVDSEKGKGSTFTLLLPLEYSQSSLKTHTVSKPSSFPKEMGPVQEVPVKKSFQQENKFSFKDDRENIGEFNRLMLIIEDDEEFAKILYDLAHEMNFGAIVTPSGDEGMELAKEYLPNAIVLDMRLPDHSGMVVLDNLKMSARTRHIPVHVISSSDFSKSALEMGAIGYMLKPVKRNQLLTAFQNMNAMLEQKVKHVLVVEDDKVQSDHIVDLLSDHAVKVEAVETSSEALKRLSERTYDCMIMDLSLPDMSGHELLSKLSNENSTYSFPPVIVYTARDLTAEEEEKLRLYSGSIIIKGAKSPERLLSEVTLFLHRVETDLPPERQKMLRDLRNREKNLQDQKILIVDDDVRNIFALTSALEGYGARIETARNGREALEKLDSAAPIDLVLMDIMMPEMDGYEAMRRIRLHPEHKDVLIIALTAKAMKDDKEKCLEAGANDYLPKPLEIDKLLSLIRVWLPQKRSFTK